jgi:hypothetical protein
VSGPESPIIALKANDFLPLSASREFSANEVPEITIARKIPYRSPFHDKVCEEKMQSSVKQAASLAARGHSRRLASLQQ